MMSWPVSRPLTPRLGLCPLPWAALPELGTPKSWGLRAQPSKAVTPLWSCKATDPFQSSPISCHPTLPPTHSSLHTPHTLLRPQASGSSCFSCKCCRPLPFAADEIFYCLELPALGYPPPSADFTLLLLCASVIAFTFCSSLPTGPGVPGGQSRTSFIASEPLPHPFTTPCAPPSIPHRNCEQQGLRAGSVD